MALVDLLGIETVLVSKDRVEAIMPITPEIYQPHGYVHGGSTISLLETVASIGAEKRTDFSCERPFGTEVCVRHRKGAQSGTLRGIAQLDHLEGAKQFWTVTALDDEGDVVSEGVITTKIVSLVRLAEKEQQRATKKQSA